MKRILFLTAFVPCDNNAGDKTTKIMLKELSETYLVDLVYFIYPGEKEYLPESNNINVVRVYKNSLLRKLLNVLFFPMVHPLFSVRFNWWHLLDIRALVKQNRYSAIICDYSQTFLYGKFIEKKTPKILYSMDVIAQRVSRTNGKLVQWFCKKSEKYCLSVNNSFVFTVSNKDSEMIKSLYGISAKTALAYIEDQIVNARPVTIKECDYVFMANWKRSDNIDGLRWFFDKVAPHIDFHVRINIFGINLPSDLNIIENPNLEVNIMGFVENPYPFISNCRAFLSPLFSGAGVKQKVFEALACGVPVIGNEIAFEGLDDAFNDFMLFFKDEKDFVACMKQSISLDKRIRLKDTFTHAYKSQTIPEFLKEEMKL